MMEKIVKWYYLNVEERKRNYEEKRKQKLERLEQDIRDGQFGIQIYYPDYLDRRTKKNKTQGDFPLEQEIVEMCVTCGCNIFWFIWLDNMKKK